MAKTEFPKINEIDLTKLSIFRIKILTSFWIFVVNFWNILKLLGSFWKFKVSAFRNWAALVCGYNSFWATGKNIFAFFFASVSMYLIFTFFLLQKYSLAFRNHSMYTSYTINYLWIDPLADEVRKQKVKCAQNLAGSKMFLPKRDVMLPCAYPFSGNATSILKFNFAI